MKTDHDPRGRLRTRHRLTKRVRSKTDDRLPAERRSGSSLIIAGNCHRQRLCWTKDTWSAKLYCMIDRQGKRLTTAMDSDSDAPLLNYVGMNYLRKEISKLEKLVAEKRPEGSRQRRRRHRPGVGRFLESQRWVPFTRRLPKLRHRQRRNGRTKLWAAFVVKLRKSDRISVN